MHTMYTWKELESMLARRRAIAQSEAMTPEERSERARHAVSKRKWRAVKLKSDVVAITAKTESGHPMGEKDSKGA